MSVHVMSWVLRNSPATLGDRLVLLVLADKAEEDGTNARPSVPTISQQSALSERQVQRCLRNLEGAGAIRKTGRYRYPGQNHGVNVYQVMMDNMSPLDESKGDIPDASRVTPVSPNPSLVPVQDQDLASGAAKNGKPAPTKADRDRIWDCLTDIFGPVTVKSKEQLRGKWVSELAEAGATPDEMLKRAKSWPNHFDGATLTESALVKWWDTLGRKPLRRR